MAVAETDCGRAAEEIEILTAGVVPEARAFATDREQRHAPSGLHEVLRFFFAPVGQLFPFRTQDNRWKQTRSPRRVTSGIARGERSATAADQDDVLPRDTCGDDSSSSSSGSSMSSSCSKSSSASSPEWKNSAGLLLNQK